MAVCIAVQAIGVVALVNANSAVWIVVFIVLFGGAFGAISPLRASILAEQFGRRAYGSIIATQGVFVAICAGLGPFIAGNLYDTLGSYRLAFWLVVAMLALACVGVAATPHSEALVSTTTMQARGEPRALFGLNPQELPLSTSIAQKVGGGTDTGVDHIRDVYTGEAQAKRHAKEPAEWQTYEPN